MINIYAPRQRLAVVTLVTNEKQEILLVKNKKRGWELPGGYVDQGETLHEAAVREVEEETGIVIQLSQLLGLEQKIAKQTFIIVFRGEKIGGVLRSSPETAAAGFFSQEQALIMMTQKADRERIYRSIKQSKLPFVIDDKAQQG